MRFACGDDDCESGVFSFSLNFFWGGGLIIKGCRIFKNMLEEN